jgi:hypothetical protein
VPTPSCQETGFWEARSRFSNEPTKVNLLCPNPGLKIAFHSPKPLLKPDCVCALRRKGGTVTSSPTSSPFSAVRNNREIRAFFAYFGAERAKILVWRSAQSGANLSPREFPANRENNREFANF